MPWPQKRRLLGTKVPRLDGPEKATGRARYTYDINRPGMLHAKILRCPHAHARIQKIDTTAAQKMPGFRAIYNINVKPGQEIFYAGLEILAIACDTEEHCDDAIHAVRVDYEILPFKVREEDAIRDRKQPATTGGGAVSNVTTGNANQSKTWNANVFDGLTVHEGNYGLAVICHQSLETHGIVCEFDEKRENLTVWSSSQNVVGTANGLAMSAGIPAARIKSITHYMGGGFGSKFGNEVENVACAALARSAGAPVKLMLDRSEEATKGGLRPSAYARVKIGATKQGDIRAFEAIAYGTAGTGAGFNLPVLPYVYQPSIPNTRTQLETVRLNTQTSRAWRGPGHPQCCTLTDQPVDDLAARLNMNPMDFRLRNLPPNAGGMGGQSWNGMRRTVYEREIGIARDISQWNKKWHAPGAGAGPIKTGIGMAIHTWGGAGQNQANDVRVTISNDGSVLAQCSTQDLGTGNRTVLAIVAAEILGLEVTDITVRIGESPFGGSTASGGSSTCPSVAPTTLAAATAARDAFLTAIAGPMGTQAANLRIEPGVVVNTTNNARTPWRQACAMLGVQQISASRANGGNDQNTAGTGPAAGGGVGGVQVAEVKVDTETGVVRCLNFWAVQDCGLIVNKLCCESQVAGGVIMSINAALFEERVMDARTGRQCNADMEFYKLGGILDMPNIHVHMLDMPERGVIGIGEPPTVSAIAAIGNAVFNAIGRRVPHAPFTPERVLAALAAK
ncbi:MAG TPA: xanthine dehydrogenase family protein molybdopterin-binding subunit [Gemmataceae bacterium]|nr:xanthine dehydrogenase family protein molybdopterin-binding subunit [Gemmataceae bacterium]